MKYQYCLSGMEGPTIKEAQVVIAAIGGAAIAKWIRLGHSTLSSCALRFESLVHLLYFSYNLIDAPYNKASSRLHKCI